MPVVVIYSILLLTVIPLNAAGYAADLRDISSAFPFKLPIDNGIGALTGNESGGYQIVKSSPKSATQIQAIFEFDPLLAKKYLVSQYNPNIGLIRENEYFNTYWLWSDNVLASKVLKDYDQSLSKNIDYTIQSYKWKYNVDMLSAYAVLVDQITKTSFKPPQDRNLVENIWYTNYDFGNSDLSCKEYADIAFLKSIYLYKNNQIHSSKSCYNSGVSMYDGIGFKDKAFYASGNLYSTYKIALWKLASSITGFGKTHEPTNIMGKLQNIDTGGIYTHYDANLSPYGYTNVETTSLTVMAYPA